LICWRSSPLERRKRTNTDPTATRPEAYKSASVRTAACGRRSQARMRELAEQARERIEVEATEERRREEERDAKLKRSQEEKAQG
jgi:hypothetical protein